MRTPNSIGGFVLRFAALYLLLLGPWPGWNQGYSDYFRSLCRADEGLFNDPWSIRFEQLRRTRANPLDTRILLASPTATNADGLHPAVALDLDSRSIGWVPTALLLALVLSTPMNWSRLVQALLGGLAAVHVFIAFSVRIHIVSQALALPGAEAMGLSAWQKQALGALDQTLITQIGASFTVPVLIWALVALRVADWREAGGNPGRGRFSRIFAVCATGGLRRGNIRAKRPEIV
jgi:hypothetical protein